MKIQFPEQEDREEHPAWLDGEEWTLGELKVVEETFDECKDWL